MLHALTEYADSHGIHGEAGFSNKRIRWLLNFSPDGKYLGLIAQNQPGAKPGVAREFNGVPHLKFSGDTPMRQFLVDTSQYMLLFGKEPLAQDIWEAFLENDDEIQSLQQGIQDLRKKPRVELAEKLKLEMKSQFPKKTQKAHLLKENIDRLKEEIKLLHKHAYCLDLLSAAGEAEPFLKEVAHALCDENILATICDDLKQETPQGKPIDNVTFAEIGSQGARIIIQEDTWRDWWRGYFPTLFKKKKDGASMRCLISGTLCKPSSTHPKIKGIGGDIGGKEETTLVGFNLAPFCSYGLEQSSNAAVAPEQAEQYAAALNELIAHHSHRLTGTKVVHWYAGKDEVPDEMDPLNFLTEASDEEDFELDAQHRAHSFLDSIRTGKPEILDCRYYILTLSGSSARVMVRDWMEGRFEELVRNTDAWFSDLAIVKRKGDGLAKRPKFLAVLGGLVRDLKDVSPPVEAKLWRVAVRKEPIPEFAMAQALGRVKVDIIKDEPIRHARMGLLKAYHIRKGDTKMQPNLNEEHPNPAYHCGRLMAVYADLQHAALGDVGAGVVQRYYAAASATPALVLGRLSRGGQFHLNKLDGGLAHWFEERLAGIWACFEKDPPKTLTLEEQSLFALGYYQQKAAPRKKNNDNNTQTGTEGE